MDSGNQKFDLLIPVTALEALLPDILGQVGIPNMTFFFLQNLTPELCGPERGRFVCSISYGVPMHYEELTKGKVRATFEVFK